MTVKPPTWLLLITNLPGHNPTLRMRLWRSLKGVGAGSLRDGVYVLPDSGPARKVFEEHAKDIKEEGGSGARPPLGPRRKTDGGISALFDRTTEYAEVAAATERAARRMGTLIEVRGDD